MARMSREFSLVLVGATVLTAGYFYLRNEDSTVDSFDRETQSRSHHLGGHLLWVNHTRPGGTTNTGMRSVSRGGFGSIGAHTAGG